jgi:hypothetical protein
MGQKKLPGYFRSIHYVALTVLAGGAYFDTNHIASAINASHKWKEFLTQPAPDLFADPNHPAGR